MTGWASWDTPRVPRQQLKVNGVDQVRFCPRCDARTVWTLDGNANQPGLLACGCGMTVTTLLNLDELDNTQRHYRLTTGDLDDIVGLPASARV